MTRLKGEDLDAGLVDWVKSEIKEAPKQAYDLGKFFFTVSVGTIGGLATLEKLNQVAAMDTPFWTSTVLLFVSILVALDMARPRELKIGGETELQNAYHVQIRAASFRVWVWFAFWLLGAIVGGYAIKS